MKFMLAVFTLLVTAGAQAEQSFELRGRFYACKDASTMNLWDISGNSELIRYQMLQKDYCWKTVEGLGVQKIGETKQFAQVEFSSGHGRAFFVYKTDLRLYKEPIKKPEPVPKTELRSKLQLRAIKNIYEGKVVTIQGRPTVDVEFNAGAGLSVYFTIVKEKIVQGFEERISNQQSPNITLGGECKGVLLGLAPPDYFSVNVKTVDRIKRFVEFEVSGRWEKCDPSKSVTFEIQPSILRVEGTQFDQLIRSHTSQEMKKTIGG